MNGRTTLRVLEIGFARGELLAHLLTDGHEVVGVDADASRVDETVRQQAELHESTAEEMKLPTDHFDLIIAIHVIEHFEEPAKVMKTCLDALREDGLLYMVTPNAASWGLRLFGKDWWNLEDPTHRRLFSPQSARRMLEGLGFEDVRAQPLWWDGIRVEANSLLRRLYPPTSPTGIEGHRWARVACALLVPWFVMMRLFCRQLTPNLEIVARKPHRVTVSHEPVRAGSPS